MTICRACHDLCTLGSYPALDSTCRMPKHKIHPHLLQLPAKYRQTHVHGQQLGLAPWLTFDQSIVRVLLVHLSNKVLHICRKLLHCQCMPYYEQ